MATPRSGLVKGHSHGTKCLPRSESTTPGVAQWQKRPPLKAKLCARTEVLLEAMRVRDGTYMNLFRKHLK